MDWDLAIKRNSEILAGIVETLFAMLGLVGEAAVSRLPRPTYRAVLRVLRPAESALRRLIVIAARGLVVEPGSSRPRPAGPVKPRKGACQRSLSFQLFDPRKRIMLPRRMNAQAARPAYPHVQRRQRTGDHMAAAPASSQPRSRPAQIR